MSITTIQKILKNQIYKDGFEDKHSGGCKLTYAIVKDIRKEISHAVGGIIHSGATAHEARLARGIMYRRMATKYTVSSDTIRRIYKHQIWINRE